VNTFDCEIRSNGPNVCVGNLTIGRHSTTAIDATSTAQIRARLLNASRPPAMTAGS
jgi:hypothetical protein